MAASSAGNACVQCQHAARVFDRFCTQCGTKLPQKPQAGDETDQAMNRWLVTRLNKCGFNDPEAPRLGKVEVCDSIFHTVIETKHCPRCGRSR